MLIWGGGNSSGFFGDGGRYDPTTDSWLPITINNAPTARTGHTTVWTTSEMIVWGGLGSGGPSGTLYLNTGARYNPATDTWTPISTNGAPAARASNTAIWTGSEMIVWGGLSFSGVFPGYVATNYADGARYNPATDTWLPLSMNGAPTARYSHASVWTGSEMLVWGGASVVYSSGFVYTYFSTGARYNPATDTWTTMSSTGAPSARYQSTVLPAVWSGSEMIVWGGGTASASMGDGGRYSPASDTWSAVTTAGAPGSRYQHTMIWTGSEMIVFGGYSVPAGVYYRRRLRLQPITADVFVSEALKMGFACTALRSKIGFSQIEEVRGYIPGRERHREVSFQESFGGCCSVTRSSMTRGMCGSERAMLLAVMQPFQA